MVVDQQRPNRLLWALVGVSICIHVLIFTKIFECYSTSTMSYINLTLRQSPPDRPERDIPHPSVIKAPPPVAQIPKSVQIAPRPAPSLAPAPEAPISIARTAAAITAAPSVPQQPDLVSAPSVTAVAPKAFSTPRAAFDSKGAYLGMVRQRVEAHKVYPDSAHEQNLEGRVTVRFTITHDGRIKDIAIITAAPYPELNAAALKAVSAAAPFPPPPTHIFPGDIHLDVVIVFKLT